ncbi:MAG: ABC transporter substrate-binding protein [Deltaproteobacteria bacterium]|nr:ABC transporter substrate-binding protein [Deltaproteobacteria bacterium]
MKKQIIALTFSVLFLALVNGSAPARAADKIPRVGILFIGGKDQPHLESFKQGLRDLGYSEGKNIILIYRYAEGKQERLADLAAELVRDKVDIIVTTASIGALAARRVTQTLPIVMTTGNPLSTGLADSLAKPGGNVTGLSVMPTDLTVKRLELLKESFPKKTRVAALWNLRESGARTQIKETEEAAKVLSLRLHPLEIMSADDIDLAFTAMTKARDQAIIILTSPLATLNSKRIVDLALKHRLPGIYPTRQFVEEGGLMAYGPLIGDLYRRAATYVDKILKGRTPADLPVEQPMKFDFIVNLKAAKQIGVTVPPNVLVRADKVIR